MAFYDRGASDAPPDLERIARDVKSALVDLRNSVDSGAEDTKSNIQAYLANYEDHIAGPRALAAAADRQRIELLEKAVSTGAPLDQCGEPDWSRTHFGRSDSPEYKSFIAWLTNGRAAEFGTKGWKPGDFDVKTLRTDSDTAGGYPVPAVMDAQVRKNIIEVSPIRRYARARIAYQSRSTSRDAWPSPSPLLRARQRSCPSISRSMAGSRSPATGKM